MSKYLDGIVYINLDKRTDRRDDIEKELNDFQLPYERFSAIETPGQGILGCGYSHLAVFKLAKERGYKNILILEDDFTFLISKDEFESELTRFFEANVDYEVCMISYNLIRSEESPEYPFLHRTIEAHTASGYIVNENMYDKLIELYEWGMPLLKSTGQHWIYANDQLWKKFQDSKKWYCFKTRCGKQKAGFSDNSNQYYNHNC
jgi:glycosyl transferase family 25